MTTITVFGLGLMGRPMANALKGAGWDVRGWNRSPLAADLKGDLPICDTLKEAAESDICLLMLADSAATDAVLAQLEPFLEADKLVLDMGSSNPARSSEHAARLTGRGIGWVDAPVSGGPSGASSGTLAIMAGGSDEDIVRVMPILHVLGGNVVHVGPAGAGHTAKAVNQLIVGLTIEAVAEALVLAESSGIDPRLIQRALKGGFADSLILQIHGSRMADRAYIPGGKARMQLKDLRYAQELADQAGLRLPHLESTVKLYEQLVEQGDGDLDHSALHKLLG